ncbi:MAG: hypothetical protein FD147_586 [Chloroflexi bacterium]|nr:MAG: hypothetical protein FD147_586 [Chloroflexota bacterium]MBA4376407.1 hypothetical protein [Anaerolinea sp.]
MDKNKSLQYNFAFEAMPILFHSQTSGFMNHLEKDGIEFIKFWWNHVGDRMEESKRITPAGITFDVEQIDKNTRLVLITLPTPKEDGDAYFLALIARPEKRFAWVRLPNTAVYVLSRYDECQAKYQTAFGELSPRGLYRERGIGLNPTKLDFKRVVKAKLEKNKPEKKI